MDQSDLVGNSIGVDVKCPVCVSPSYVTGSIPGWGVWLRCRHCTLLFVHPLELGDEPNALYQAAYNGEESRSEMGDYAERLRMRQAVLSSAGHPAYREIIAWLNHRFTQGTTVLELGCALGLFLHALKREGFKAVGLDVAEIPVMLNRRDGFDVWHGTLESMPSEWVQPDAVVCLFVLQHVDNPRKFLRKIRDQWPNAPLVLALHTSRSNPTARSSPPRTLTRWNVHSMSEALTQAGYVATVEEIPLKGAVNETVAGLARSFTWLFAIPVVYRLLKRVSNLKPLRRDTNFLLAFAEPQQN